MMALEGIRIVDFTQIEQGPVGTLMLADFGADVIKVEPVGVGARGRGAANQAGGIGMGFAANNRNKRSITVDLKKPEGKEVVHRLVRVSDVVANNYRPGVMERLGLGFDDLQKINPRIICAYASGYGQTGPYRDKHGQDLFAQALGGIMALTGVKGGPPMVCGTYIADYLGAMHLAIGIAMALLARERTGRGQVVDSCLLNAALACHLQEGAAHLNQGKLYPRALLGEAHSGTGPLYASYEAGDGKSFVIVPYFVDNAWQRVCTALGIPRAVADDPRFQTNEGLAEHDAEVMAIVADTCKKFTREEALRLLEEQSVPSSPVHEYPAVFQDPQIIHNQMILETEHPTAGKLKLIGMPIKLSDTPAGIRMPPPLLGQHNQEVLRSLGYSDDEIQALRDKGAVGSEDLKPVNATPAG